MPAGRPPHFDNPESLFGAFTQYAADCLIEEVPLTISGFCKYVESYRDMLSEYAKKPEFSSTIKMIYNYIENDLEIGMLKNKYNSTGSIFSLKNNFGWKDKQEIDQTTHNINETYESFRERLDKEAREAREVKQEEEEV